MYIRRKVFSSFIDENGEERYFSTTEFEYEQQREFTYIDEAGNLVRSDGTIVKSAKELNKVEELTEKQIKSAKRGKGTKATYAGSKGGMKPAEPNWHDVTDAERKANTKNAKKVNVDKKWNKSDAYKASKKEAAETIKNRKEMLEPYTNKINNLTKKNKRLAIGAAALGTAAIGAGTYAGVKAHNAKKAAMNDED